MLQYAAVTICADIAFVASHLASFIRNPSQEHQLAVNNTITYLYQTKSHTIQYSILPDSKKNKVFIAAADAAYTDNYN